MNQEISENCLFPEDFPQYIMRCNNIRKWKFDEWMKTHRDRKWSTAFQNFTLHVGIKMLTIYLNSSSLCMMCKTQTEYQIHLYSLQTHRPKRIWIMEQTRQQYLLIYSMQHSPSWEANWFAASQEIPWILWNPKVYYHIHKFPAICLYPEPAQSSPYPTSYLLKSHLNIILPSMPGSPQWSLSLSFPHLPPSANPSSVPHQSHSR
jgi:CRISPR/Cas system-associated protein endoribonuclease Cas2